LEVSVGIMGEILETKVGGSLSNREEIMVGDSLNNLNNLNRGTMAGGNHSNKEEIMDGDSLNNLSNREVIMDGGNLNNLSNREVIMYGGNLNKQEAITAGGNLNSKVETMDGDNHSLEEIMAWGSLVAMVETSGDPKVDGDIMSSFIL
jgi:hypothetical protein